MFTEIVGKYIIDIFLIGLLKNRSFNAFKKNYVQLFVCLLYYRLIYKSKSNSV